VFNPKCSVIMMNLNLLLRGELQIYLGFTNFIERGTLLKGTTFGNQEIDGIIILWRVHPSLGNDREISK
jgi:hypothetical protein